MSYSYSNPLNYGNQRVEYNNAGYDKSQKVSAPAVTAAAVVGAAAGGGIGSTRVPYFKKGGDITDSFAKISYDNYIKKEAPEAEKELYIQSNKILNKLDKTKTADELKKLLDENPKAKNIISADVISGINNDNLASNKETIKKSLEAKKGESFQKIKNIILECWDGKEKKFKKPNSITDTQYNTIKKAARRVKTGTVAIFAAAGALITSSIFCLCKLITNSKKNV